MPPTPAAASPPPPPESDDLILESFQQRWRESEVDLLDFWRKQLTSRSLTLLTALVKADLLARFERGLRPSAADYLAIFPDLRGDRERVISLVYEEFCLLEDREEHPDVSQFCARYGAWSDSLRSQLAYHRELSQIVGLPRARSLYPEVGSVFETFELREVLGEGGAARVYRAADRSIGGREVVLKLSNSIGVELKILGRLDHKNIVPIHKLVEPPGSELRGICMPYYPGATLDKVLEKLAVANRPRRAATLLDLVGVERHGELEDDDAWKNFPAAGTLAEGVAWLGVKLANALQYLHSRHMHHRDIKPANVLVTPRNGLWVIDFNLAEAPHTAEFAQAASRGGTLPYMAPEQLRAFLNPEAWGEVGAAADIYACGLLLREMVTGQKPFIPADQLPTSRAISEVLDRRRAPVPSCRDVQGDIPPSLDAIIRKCLAYEPAGRYPTAEALSLDLRRFLKRLPPIVARSPSPLETTVNWAFRRRKLIASFACACLLACGLGLFLAGRGDVRRAPEFLRGATLLKSSRQADWQQAFAVFQNLSCANLQTAWPLVYQKVAADMLQDKTKAGVALVEASRRDDAVAVFREYLQAHPSDSSVWVALGRVHSGAMDLNQAEHCLDEAREHLPEHPGILAELGELKRKQRRYDEAIDCFERAMINPSRQARLDWLPKVRKNLVNVLIVEIDKRLAEPAGRPATPEGPSPRWCGVDELLDKLNTQITLLAEDWESITQEFPDGGYSCTLCLFRAELASARGYHAGSSSRQVARREFQRAEEAIEEADRIAAAATSSRDAQTIDGDHDFAQQVIKLRIKLDQRLEECGMDLESP